MSSLNFKGKTAVWNHHLSVPYHTLEKDKNSSLPGESENLIIEGDNLLALKALLPKYQGRVQCIYIDPPYNTGEEGWIYNDNVNNPIIKQWIGQIVGKEGEDLTRHDKWLCMMTPRLKLLRELLSDYGVIFISIDGNEVHHLISLMNEVFGEDNHVANLIWRKRKGGGNDSQFFAVDHEYILVYTNNKSLHGDWRIAYDEIYLTRYKEEDGISKFYWDTLSRPGLNNPIIYDVTCPDKTIIKNGTWQVSEETFHKKLKIGEIKFEKNKNGGWTVFHKIRLPSGKVLRSILEIENMSVIENTTNKDAADEMLALFGKQVFDNPKPSKLIKTLISLIADKDSIILDSFAGSGTTGQAVLELNNEGDNRKFILIQLPETLTEKAEVKAAGYKHVHEITRDRISKVIKRDKIKTGFTYYKLGPSIDAKSLLEGKKLPNWENFAKYVHYLATGKPLDEIKKPDTTWEIRTTNNKKTGVYLIYIDRLEELKNLAITRDWLESIKQTEGKKIVYAPACFLDKEILDEYHISFVQIPFNLFQRN